ncbi:MAG: PAS domain-containing protein [Methylococcales bacterium]
MHFNPVVSLKFFLSVLIPLLAALFQWLLWSKIPPLTWLFLYPAVFMTAWINGLAGGLIATVLAALLGRYFFIEPQLSWVTEDSRQIYSLGIFMSMGVMFSLVFEGVDQLSKKSQLIKTYDKEFYLLAEAMPQVVWISDAEGLITYINKQWELFTGIKLEQSYGNNWNKPFHPDDRQLAWEAWQATLNNNAPINFEGRVRRYDGVYRWCSILGEPVYGENHKIVKYFGTCTDIDDFKQAETELHNAEARWKFALEGSNQGVWDWDIATNQVFFSSRWKSLLGYAENEITNEFEEWSKRVHPDELEPAMLNVQKHIRGETPYFVNEHRMLNRSGEYQWILARGMVVKRDQTGQALRMIGTHIDITERKNIEQQLHEKEQFLTDSQAAAHIGSYRVDLASGQIRWSEETYRLFGLSPEIDVPPTLEQFPQLLYPADRQKRQDWISLLLAGKPVDALEFRTLPINGESRWLSSVAKVERGDSGEPLGMIGTLQNITDQKAKEEQRKENEAALKEAQKLAKIGYWQWDLDANVHIWSEEIYGFYARDPSLPPLVYPEVQQYFTPESWVNIVAAVEQAQLDGLPYECDAELVRADGSHGWIVARGQAVYDDAGIVVKLHGTLQDITLRKQAEEQLRKFAQAIEQISESIVITNLKAEIEYVNEAFIINTGYLREELIGQNLRILQSGKTPRESFEALWTALSQGKTWKGEFYNRRKEGSEYIDFAVITPLHQADGRVTHYVGVQEDVTEKKRLDVELDQYRHHLEELVWSRTAQLETAKTLADVANQSKSMFLANMSHEIRTPMNAIIGFTYLLRQSASDLEQISRLHKIDEAAHHLLSIINDILDLSKIEAGHLTLEQSNFALGDLLDSVLALISDQARVKGLRLELDTDHVPLWLRGDLMRLRQALLNYASNAVKFTHTGFIKLSARNLEENDAGLLIRFEVQDSGIGIPQDKLPLLFEVFTQADTSTTRHYGGTGLGLAITRRVANLMGGEAGVESTLGQGSCFWFTARVRRGLVELPVNLTEKSVADEMSMRQQFSGARVLLVEDNLINQEVALVLLQRIGLIVDTAENGYAAVEKVRMQDYDLVLMDVQMPELDGLDATRVIRTLSNKMDLPILAMTANAFEEDKKACLEAGMNDFVAKPVMPEALSASLLYWLPKQNLSTDATANQHKPQGTVANRKDDLQTVERLASELACLSGVKITGAIEAIKQTNSTKFIHLLQLFATTHGQDIQHLQLLLAKGDVNEAKQITHSLKGVVSTLGLYRLTELVNNLDAALSDNAALAECILLTERCEPEFTALVNHILHLTGAVVLGSE